MGALAILPFLIVWGGTFLVPFLQPASAWVAPIRPDIPGRWLRCPAASPQQLQRRRYSESFSTETNDEPSKASTKDSMFPSYPSWRTRQPTIGRLWKPFTSIPSTLRNLSTHVQQRLRRNREVGQQLASNYHRGHRIVTLLRSTALFLVGGLCLRPAPAFAGGGGMALSNGPVVPLGRYVAMYIGRNDG
jgi:hypothetical protein